MDGWMGKQSPREPGDSKSAEDRTLIPVFSLSQHQTSENEMKCFPYSLNWVKCVSSPAHGILSIVR